MYQKSYTPSLSTRHLVLLIALATSLFLYQMIRTWGKTLTLEFPHLYHQAAHSLINSLPQENFHTFAKSTLRW
jgi:hypothetical protein